MGRREIMDLYGKEYWYENLSVFTATKLYLMLSFDLIFNALVLRRNHLKNLEERQNGKAFCIVSKVCLIFI